MLRLRWQTPRAYVEVVRANVGAYLQDHAHNERKVAQSALELAVQHHDRPELVGAMIEVADEEFRHFRQVYALLQARGLGLGIHAPDRYVTALRKEVRRATVQNYLLDRLVVFALIEARACERFGLAGEAMAEPALRSFYEELVRSESRHHATYLRLAREYFAESEVAARVEVLLEVEAKVAAQLPLRPALH